jgi:hypothetical protein
MISFSDNNLANNFMTMDELRKACPMAFKSNPTNPNVSDRYIHANTATVVEDLEKLGWMPVQAKQCREKKGSRGIRSFHMVCFQNPNVKIVKQNADGTEAIDAYPRIILTNSHDGFNSFKFMLGMYRILCSNGLVVADGEMINMTIRHINYSFDELRKVVNEAIKQVPNIVMTMNTMKNTEVTDEQKREMATEVVKIRKNIEDDKKFSLDEDTIREILMPVREEDNGNDLWTVFNICQEKLIKGGYMSLGNNNKVRKQRSITSIKKDIDYNQRLWDVAMRYMPTTVAA